MKLCRKGEMSLSKPRKEHSRDLPNYICLAHTVKYMWNKLGCFEYPLWPLYLRTDCMQFFIVVVCLTSKSNARCWFTFLAFSIQLLSNVTKSMSCYTSYTTKCVGTMSNKSWHTYLVKPIWLKSVVCASLPHGKNWKATGCMQA